MPCWNNPRIVEPISRGIRGMSASTSRSVEVHVVYKRAREKGHWPQRTRLRKKREKQTERPPE